MMAMESIADQYLDASQNKTSSQTSTPFTDSYRDAARIEMAEAIAGEKIHNSVMGPNLRGVHFKRMFD